MFKDGEIYNPNDYQQQACLRLAKCYVDMSVNPPVIRKIDSGDEYEIHGWVWLKPNGELKSNGVTVKLSFDRSYFVYNGLKYPPGLYFYIKRRGKMYLVPDDFLDVIDAKPKQSQVDHQLA